MSFFSSLFNLGKSFIAPVIKSVSTIARPLLGKAIDVLKPIGNALLPGIGDTIGNKLISFVNPSPPSSEESHPATIVQHTPTNAMVEETGNIAQTGQATAQPQPVATVEKNNLAYEREDRAPHLF